MTPHDNDVENLLKEFVETEDWNKMKSRILQICESGQENQSGMRICAEILLTVMEDGRCYIDACDIIRLLRHDGILSAFEVSVNENEENKMVLLMDQIKAKFDVLGRITGVFIFIYTNGGINLKELETIKNLVDDETYFVWYITECNEPILRVTVLVKHEN